MAGLLDVHTRPPVIGLSPAELEIVINALRHRRAEYTGMRNLCDRMNCHEERERWQRQLGELDCVLQKLGDTTDEETET